MDEVTPAPTSFVAPTLEDLSPLFPAYELESFIAQGGMGAVYKARQKSLDRDVAIKILPREFGADPQFRASFEAEAKAMARLNHPNLISVYDFGDIEGMLFIVMEFVKGKALFYSVHKKAIDPKVALPLVSTISRGLAHAHKGGIIHRDIKPANILLDTDATPKIGDFGLARPIELDDSEGIVFGTPGYTAPEVFHRQPVDQRSDIFSIGALLYELLVGRHPAPDTNSMASGIDPRIDAILAKATHVSPGQRYASADQLADDLDALLIKLSGPQFSAPLNQTAPPKHQPLLASQKKPSAFPVFIALALLGAATAFFLLNKEEPTPPVIEQPAEKKEAQTKKTKSPKKDRRNRKPRPEPEKTEPKPAPTPAPEKKSTPPKPTETPLESLARLEKSLKRGEFKRLPIGTIKRENSAYFLHPTPMTAAQAHALAGTYNATLATAPTTADLDFLRSSFPDTKSLWIGASDTGLEGKWYWVDGTSVAPSLWAPGAPDNKVTSAQEGQDFAILTQEGLQDATRTDLERPLLEWKLTGTNPGTISAQLGRTAASLAAKSSPIFPAASFEYKGSRYLLHKKWTDHQEASAIAEQSGGHLAVLSSQEEASFLTAYLSTTLTSGEGSWFGGARNESNRQIWETPTGEIFTFHPWLPDQPNDLEENENSLEYRDNSEGGGARGFNDASPHNNNLFLLIEWSHPTLRNMPKASDLQADDEKLLSALEEVRQKTRDKHGRKYRKFRRSYDETIQDFLDNTISDINNEERLSGPVRAVIVEGIKEYKDKNELPDSLPKAAPNALKRRLDVAKEESKSIKEQYDEDYEKAKEEHLEALIDAADDAIKTGAVLQGEIFILEHKAIEKDGNRFQKIMDREKVPLPEKPEEEKKEEDGE